MSMDAVHESQQPIDVGVCHQHNRVFQCYCTQCFCMICPSCLMFDAHKNHQVCRIQQGSRDLRGKINLAAKDGLLKFEKTQNVLLDVRHAKLSLQQNLQKLLKTAQQTFDKIIKTIKARKQTFIQQLQQFFLTQLHQVQALENSWLEKQQICQKVLKLQSSKDDLKIMEQAGYIVNGLQKLSQEMTYHQIHLIEDLQTSFIINKQKYQYNTLKDSFRDYAKKGPIITNKLRC